MIAATVENIQRQNSLELRRARRDKVRLGAHVTLAGGALAFDCVVTNLSTEGAKLELPVAVVSLQRLTLEIPERNLKCVAHVVWRRGNGLAVHFER
jgi:hypothetical protein